VNLNTLLEVATVPGSTAIVGAKLGTETNMDTSIGQFMRAT
jgi:hypothetical protein